MLYEKAKKLIKYKSVNGTDAEKELTEKRLFLRRDSDPGLSEERMEKTRHKVGFNLHNPFVNIIKSDTKRQMRQRISSSIKILTLAMILQFVHCSASGQLYPGLKPLNPEKEGNLLVMLKNSKPDKSRAALLLTLSNLNINKPLRKKADLDRAMNFAVAASTLSSNLHDEPGYNDAELLIADIFIFLDDMESAEKISPLLNGVSRIKLYLNLSYQFRVRGAGKKTHDWNKALLYAEAARKSSVNDHLTEYEILARRDMAMVHSDESKPAAKKATKQISSFHDTAEFDLTHAQNKEGERLEVEFRTKEKENALKIKDQNILLLQQNNKLQEIKLKQYDFFKNVITLGIVGLSIVTGLLYRQYWNKQKANLMITKKGAVILQKNAVITQKNRQLELLLNEKEWLLKEVHHRVKNNLQTVICLLESQAAYLENDALKAIEKSQNRIYAMSLIHQKLYQSEDIKTINMAGYIPELVQYLKESFEISDQIYFDLHIDQISLNASQAIPLALIINEALTNAIKYAFPGNRQGKVRISVNRCGRTLRLEIADNGIGMSSQSTSTTSLGMELIKGLSKELQGNVTLKSEAGLKIVVTFEPNISDRTAISRDFIIDA